jgi:hypothetical protein
MIKHLFNGAFIGHLFDRHHKFSILRPTIFGIQLRNIPSFLKEKIKLRPKILVQIE